MLILNLKKEWYEKIRSGKKTIEYREVKPYWTKRLNPLWNNVFGSPLELGEAVHFPADIPTCTLRLGYTKRYMTADIVKVVVVDGRDTDLHIDKPVYAIHLTNAREEL